MEGVGQGDPGSLSGYQAELPSKKQSDGIKIVNAHPGEIEHVSPHLWETNC